MQGCQAALNFWPAHGPAVHDANNFNFQLVNHRFPLVHRGSSVQPDSLLLPYLTQWPTECVGHAESSCDSTSVSSESSIQPTHEPRSSRRREYRDDNFTKVHRVAKSRRRKDILSRKASIPLANSPVPSRRQYRPKPSVRTSSTAQRKSSTKYARNPQPTQLHSNYARRMKCL